MLAALGGGVGGGGCSEAGEPRAAVAAAALTSAEDDLADTSVVALARGDLVYCSGTKIAPRSVLTAAHCLSTPPDTIRVGRSAADARSVAVRRVVLHPGFDVKSLAHDVGVVELEEETPERSLPLLASPLDPSISGAPVRLIGFGRPTPEGASGDKRTGVAVASELTGGTFELRGAPSLPCVGDSGGPVIRSGEGGDVLIGVVSFGDEQCSEKAFATRIDAERDFVDAATREPGSVPDSGCALAPYRRARPRALVFLLACAILTTLDRRRSRHPVDPKTTTARRDRGRPSHS